MKWKTAALMAAAFAAILLGISIGFASLFFINVAPEHEVANTMGSMALHLPFIYSFNSPGTLYEAGSAYESTSPYWWVDSGGKLVIVNGAGETIQGALPPTDPWYQIYKISNPTDTDGGAHPQNIFRLLTQGAWENVSEQAQFYINKDELSASPNRNGSNGLLLMSRYGDAGQTLYYAGIRVDGTAVIKKKYHGTYYTMAQKQIFAGQYDPAKNPNLLPHGEWISLKSTNVTNADGSVTVTLFMERQGQNTWTQLLTATDTGKNYGATPAITGQGFGGVRTDFMDVEFDNFRIDAL